MPLAVPTVLRRSRENKVFVGEGKNVADEAESVYTNTT